ncbi:hypothetical protein BBM68_06520 [Vibrio parahaemolyticus]|uniref:hypothetical protein n=1 Tax=Vibrio parahaemolyticus TaxID=670 RepID=UPI00084B3D42|nr:hypothetical protein [Vibrio parahaemolyticus]OEA74933.1 hypothetical protein BBM67_12335 [Vibrio parahaemolyticus]OEA77464.1 hypothetical protein BBM68_06520 [Vibrio parahaemolyticus]
MKFEDLENEQIRGLVQAFYVYQSALIRSPLGQVGIGEQPDFPIYFRKYNRELEQIASELLKVNIVVKEAKLPEKSKSFDHTSFLQDFEHQMALKFVLVLGDKVIQPPEQLELMMRGFIERLATPWH